jgi:hypothetical protein
MGSRPGQADDRLPHFADICRCSPATGGCGEYFNSTAAFDKHRVGRHGVDRRCRTEAEMLAAGMVRNAAGSWLTKAFENARLPSAVPRHAAIADDPLPDHSPDPEAAA